MHQKRTSFSLGSCIGHILLLSCFAITAGGGQSNQNKVKTTKRNTLARARQIDTQVTERLRSDIKNKLYCTHINCWQKAATCTQHTQAHPRLLPPVLLDKIGQFLGAPSGLRHKLDIYPASTCTMPSTASAITASRNSKTTILYLTYKKEGSPEHQEDTLDKYPCIICYITLPSIIKRNQNTGTQAPLNLYLSYDTIENTGHLYIYFPQNQGQSFDAQSAPITPLHGGFLARYVTLRLLGIPMKTAQRYNRMESDMPKPIKPTETKANDL